MLIRSKFREIFGILNLSANYRGQPLLDKGYRQNARPVEHQVNSKTNWMHCGATEVYTPSFEEMPTLLPGYKRFCRNAKN